MNLINKIYNYARKININFVIILMELQIIKGKVPKKKKTIILFLGHIINLSKQIPPTTHKMYICKSL